MCRPRHSNLLRGQFTFTTCVAYVGAASKTKVLLYVVFRPRRKRINGGFYYVFSENIRSPVFNLPAATRADTALIVGVRKRAFNNGAERSYSFVRGLYAFRYDETNGVNGRTVLFFSVFN